MVETHAFMDRPSVDRVLGALPAEDANPSPVTEWL